MTTLLAVWFALRAARLLAAIAVALVSLGMLVSARSEAVRRGASTVNELRHEAHSIERDLRNIIESGVRV